MLPLEVADGVIDLPGKNEFTFKTDTHPSPLFIDFEAKVDPPLADVEAALVWTSEAIGESQPSWLKGHPGKKPTVRYLRLPENNSSFGRKLVTVVPPDGSGCTRSVVMEIFYPKTASNYPPPAQPIIVLGSQPAPNWFFYWNQAAPIGDPDALYNSGGEGYGYFDPATPQKIRIHSGAAGKVEDQSDDFRPSLEFVGIDAFASVVRHERQHRTNWNETNGANPAADADKDWLRDTLETSEDWDLNAQWDQEQLTPKGKLLDNGLLRLERQGKADNAVGRPPNAGAKRVFVGSGDGQRTSEAGADNQFHDRPGPTIMQVQLPGDSGNWHDNSRCVGIRRRQHQDVVVPIQSRWDDEHDTAFAAGRSWEQNAADKVAWRLDWGNPGRNHKTDKYDD